MRELPQELRDMAVRRHSFEDIFKAQDPFVRSGFHLFLREVAGSRDPKVLREFFIRLNGELYRASWIDKRARVPWAGDMLAALVNANAQLTTTALRELLEEMKLHYQDPLADVMFEAASTVPALFSLLSEVVLAEGQLVQLRVRALEALFTRLSLGRRAFQSAAGVEETLRSFNDILEELNRETLKGTAKSTERLSKDLQAVGPLLPGPTPSRPGKPPEHAHPQGPGQTPYPAIVELRQTPGFWSPSSSTPNHAPKRAIWRRPCCRS